MNDLCEVRLPRYPDERVGFFAIAASRKVRCNRAVLCYVNIASRVLGPLFFLFSVEIDESEKKEQSACLIHKTGAQGRIQAFGKSKMWADISTDWAWDRPSCISGRGS